MRLSKVLRKAVQDYEPNRAELSRKSGVAQSQLSRFATGERTVNLDAVDLLVEALGLQLVPKTRRKGR